MASPKVYGGEQGHDSVYPLWDTFSMLGVFFDCLAPFAANKQVWGPRTMPVATWSMQGKVAWIRAREGVTGERGALPEKEGR